MITCTRCAAHHLLSGLSGRFPWAAHHLELGPMSYDFHFAPNVYHCHAVLRYILAMPHALMTVPVEQKQLCGPEMSLAFSSFSRHCMQNAAMSMCFQTPLVLAPWQLQRGLGKVSVVPQLA